ncbi:9562_t:CDS:2, partial [Scutellospora calospora]
MEGRVYKFDYLPEVPADIRVVVGIDFGTTFSGFAYANVSSGEVISNEDWPGIKGPKKLPTVLQYDESFSQVTLWGFDALAREPPRRRKKVTSTVSRPIELFKLHLGDIPEKQKPILPSNITAEKAITDYLQEMGIIKEEVEKCWPGIDFFKMVRLMITVPAGFTEDTKTIMRQCMYNANLISISGTQSLKFTTEPEAAAVHCMKVIKDHGLKIGDKYLVVDCGGGTVDLTVRKLLENNQLGEDTERSGDFCGSTYVDKEFIKYLKKKVGENAIKMLSEKHYSQLSYMVQQFCERVKTRFTGVESEFRPYSLEIEKICPALKQYVSGNVRDELSEEEDWEIEFDFTTVKSFFDPVIRKILQLINDQINKNVCSIIFLVGGFSESKYLQKRVRQKFSNYKVAVPPHPMAAIARGAVEYGLDMDKIKTRVVKWTYGIELYSEFDKGDPLSRKTSDGLISKFKPMAKRGLQVEINQKFSTLACPRYPNQDCILFKFFYTPNETAKFIDEPGMNKLGEFRVELSDKHLGLNRPVTLTLCFGAMEIIAEAKNEINGKVYRTTFQLELSEMSSM